MANHKWLHIAAIVIIAGTIFFTSLGKARLWDRDEPRNAGCAVEMMERGDLVVPMFNDELRHQKPALLYWLMITAYSVFGVNEFAARFWSATLAIGSVLLTYGIARRLFGGSVAILAALALTSNIMFCVAARAATPDSTLIFFSTLGIFWYVIGTIAPSGDSSTFKLKHEGHWFPQNYWYVLAMNVSFALAVLTKGPIGIIIPTAIIGMFLLLQRLPGNSDSVASDHSTSGKVTALFVWLLKLINPIHFLQTCWYMRPLTALGTVLLVAAPWYVLVGIQTDGQFTQLFFLNENFARATTVMENHSGSWLYYPATIAVGFFPWSIFLAPTILATDQHLSHQTAHNAAIKFLVCWVVVQVGLFSLAETKLPSYITPCYPALAMLTSFCLVNWLPANVTGRNWQVAASATFIAAGFITAIGLGVAAGMYFPQIWWIATLGLIPIVGGSIAILFLVRQQAFSATLTTTIASVLFCLFMFGVGTVAVDSTRQTDLLLNQIKLADTSSEIATYHCLESSWVFYGRKPIYELERMDQNINKMAPESEPRLDEMEIAASKQLERDYFWQKKPVVSPQAFATARPNAMILTTDEHAELLLAKLPAGYAVQQKVDFFLNPKRKLVLISRPAHTAAATSSTKLN